MSPAVPTGTPTAGPASPATTAPTEPLDTTGKVLRGWNPEDEAHWSAPIAWRTLVISTFSMVIAFSVFFLVSAISSSCQPSPPSSPRSALT